MDEDISFSHEITPLLYYTKIEETMSKSQNFFAQLFDFSFNDFITVKIIGIVYGIGIGLSGLFTLVGIIASFTQEGYSIIIALIVMPLSFLASIIVLRITLESVVVMFRIAQSTTRTAENTKDLRNP